MWKLVIAVIMLLVWVSPLTAQESYSEFEKSLNLSDAQKTRVDSIRRKYVGEWRSLKEESVKKRLELRELNREQPGQREKAEKVQRELDQIENSRQRLLRQYTGEVSAVFNNEQKVRYERFRDREARRLMTPSGHRLYER